MKTSCFDSQYYFERPYKTMAACNAKEKKKKKMYYITRIYPIALQQGKATSIFNNKTKIPKFFNFRFVEK